MHDIAHHLAVAFVAGPWETEWLVAGGTQLLGRSWRWLRPLAKRVVTAFGDGPRPRTRAVERFLVEDAGFLRACEKHTLKLADILLPAPVMWPASGMPGDGIPEICRAGDLAKWLDLSIGELAWFADLRGWEARHASGRLRHYHYRLLTGRGGRARLLEIPKTRLKDIQRRLLREILDRVPAHDAAHGFTRDRSTRTFASPHAGRDVVLRLDLRDFFPSISRARISALYRTLGYPEEVANLLAGLCTNVASWDLWEGCFAGNADPRLRQLPWMFARPHLPQGAPTSPALANLCARRLDVRLEGLARAANARYTRYADDLAFSGDQPFARGAQRFSVHVCATILEEGFQVNYRKTRIMRQGTRQRLAGLMVNRHVNVGRADYDRLKATLVNCARHGPQAQNRDGHADFRGHLEGRVAYVEHVNPSRGRKLRDLFRKIVW